MIKEKLFVGLEDYRGTYALRAYINESWVVLTKEYDDEKLNQTIRLKSHKALEVLDWLCSQKNNLNANAWKDKK